MMRLLLWEAFALALFYSCFCRASHTHKGNTVRAIRWAFTLLGVVSILCVLAPLWDYAPEGMAVLLLGTFTVVQVTTAHHWRKGIPAAFRRQP